MKEKEIRDELMSIRSLMERSSKFISLSGLSGMLAGVYALIGSGVAYWLYKEGISLPNTTGLESLANAIDVFLDFILIALVVLVASIATAIILSSRKAKKNGQSIWGIASRSLMFYMGVPLLTGGAFILALLSNGQLNLAVPAMLIFYGLSLLSASNFTFSDVKYLGLLEIVLGLIAACLPGYGLLFWALGFGVLHIIYGSIMYFKYDK
jgi:hypothetical protein